ncbi:hypothetical protein Acsp04_61200 [Actinomadura sp. NBRC 104425]|nr:hypothetical protein Acsp04_61200 [Actinomadura sp. NBRC 104425]
MGVGGAARRDRGSDGRPDLGHPAPVGGRRADHAADTGYQGAGAPLITPYKGKGKPGPQKDANHAHARLRGPGERAIAQLKTWHILRKLRCCPHKAGRPAKAIHVLQDGEIQAATRG